MGLLPGVCGGCGAGAGRGAAWGGVEWRECGARSVGDSWGMVADALPYAGGRKPTPAFLDNNLINYENTVASS